MSTYKMNDFNHFIALIYDRLHTVHKSDAVIDVVLAKKWFDTYLSALAIADAIAEGKDQATIS